MRTVPAPALAPVLAPAMRLSSLALVALVATPTTALDNGVGLTPIMGFDAWYAFYDAAPRNKGHNCGGMFFNCPGCFNYSLALVQTAEVMVKDGYKDAGYRVVAPSDGSAGWFTDGRGPNGEYRVDNGSWPGGVPQVQAFSDWLHDKMGLQFGWYSSRSDETCCLRIASCGFEEQDAVQFAKWRVDYLFHDSCGSPNSARIGNSCTAHPTDTPIQLYGRMAQALNKTGYRTYLKAGWPSQEASDPRNKVFDVPQRGAVANDWRLGRDDGHGIEVLKMCWDIAAPLWPYAGPGQWNDPGMLVGHMRHGQEYGMTEAQTRTQFNMAAILPAQLMIGIDIRNVSDYMRETLLNHEAIAVNQDKNGIAGRCWVAVGSHVKGPGPAYRVWGRPLADGSVAIVAANYEAEPATITCEGACFAQSNFSATDALVLRDLWTQDEQSVQNGKLVFANVPGNATSVLVTLRRKTYVV